ncbi:response regulator containing a CheY-like receiver domain and an HTH DNA-binding domain [Belliella baltica DSM 15883]|uniref:Response regulator containing a CheY-like receiver domain and an HTH DNA-binding domain n=1 Tax=Belliella baltica (strain DSM 15883 / CIP 108006 / LMG 21964 / BA134) TaxID=866536 RepID=I3Z4H4_BELBD|nr:response regulator transcription factor [Belliella baltica]AFL84142.1 response regulator containing a CheY-like receiver domain and an HTH DNA-binding domain [Belliella baltica DSM 15883]
MSVKLIIADDHPLLLKGLKDFLEENNYEILGAASDGVIALQMIEKFNPPIAILDLEMPKMTGMEVAKECLKRGLKTRIILLTLHREKYIIQQAKNLNISGYLLKNFATEDLINCIQKVSEGEDYFSNLIFPKDKNLSPTSTSDKLTPSEIKILRLIADGVTSKEIADKLFIAERTVEKHRSNIINKLKLDKKHNSLLIWAKNNKGILF